MNIRLLYFTVAIVILLASCRDKYSCECSTVVEGSPDTVYSYNYGEINKRKYYKAKNKCEELGREQEKNHNDVKGTSCTIWGGVRPVK